MDKSQRDPGAATSPSIPLENINAELGVAAGDYFRPNCPISAA